MLVNNAGIEVRVEGNRVIGAADVTAEAMRSVFETNVFGVVRVTHAFLPLLQASTAPVVVNVSSGLASLARVAAPGRPTYAYTGIAYPASKAALNMLTGQYAKAFPGIRINVVEPGYTAGRRVRVPSRRRVAQWATTASGGGGREGCIR